MLVHEHEELLILNDLVETEPWHILRQLLCLGLDASARLEVSLMCSRLWLFVVLWSGSARAVCCVLCAVWVCVVICWGRWMGVVRVGLCASVRSRTHARA